MSQQNPLKTAIKHHQSGEFVVAEKIYRDILEKEPDRADVLHLLGILLAQQKKFIETKKYIQQAVAADPNEPTFENSLGNIEKNLGQYAAALAHYEKALQLNPNYAVALNNIANIYYQQNDLDAAEQYYKKAIVLKADYTDALHNLGNIAAKRNNYQDVINYFEKYLQYEPNDLEVRNDLGAAYIKIGNFNVAAEHFAKVLAANPQHKEALHNIGSAYLLLGKSNEALKYFLQLLQFEQEAETYYNIGTIFMYQDRHEDAIQYFTEALKRKPDYREAHMNLGATYLKIENYANAIAHYKAALKLNPDDKEIAYLLTALEKKSAPDAAPSEYVEHLFDHYAPYFEKHLQFLDYHVPQLLYTAVTQEVGMDKRWIILDLGCGTGLAGEKFKPLATKLIGIDIAPKMIAIAKQKKIYDTLKVAEITQALAEFTGIDIIIASDVFTYIGNLTEIFAKAYQALKPYGLFAFTTEKTEQYPYILQQSARYAHSEKYIDELAQQQSFSIIRKEAVVLRKQKNEPVLGYLYLLQR